MISRSAIIRTLGNTGDKYSYPHGYTLDYVCGKERVAYSEKGGR